MTVCEFCSIVVEESPAYRLYEDEHTLAFLDIEPATRGHALVVPKAHYETTTGMPAALAGRVFETVHHVADALDSAYDLEGFAIVQENGVEGNQDVPHAHVHIIPRRGDDGLELGWTGESLDESTPAAVAAEIRDAVASLA